MYTEWREQTLKQLPLLALPITITFIKLFGRVTRRRYEEGRTRNEIDKASKSLSRLGRVLRRVCISNLFVGGSTRLTTLMDLSRARERPDMPLKQEHGLSPRLARKEQSEL
ncbi:hypothetical protein B5X24_HaOG202200 [Helicoverpa armigera]|uniref:Uncharacterized protein n=1 Tax=Helicoverpa armigera TaxID=29058 RepID=A0A2W1BYR3_HELAM|nr:hypothetical protein B5X24_HaOG202200 [Helicoverpa armigera]